MAGEGKEPQSYGSEGGWVSGKTGQRPNDPKATPPAEHREFYENRQEETDSRSHQGGQISSVQLQDQPRVTHYAPDERSPSPITQKHSGAKRESYFKNRDYSGK